MYIWQTKIRPSSSWWQPDPTRTLIYYKFDNNLDDSSGNSNDGTGEGTLNYTLFSWSSTDYYITSDDGVITTPLTQADVFNWAFTLSAWMMKNSSATLQRLFKKNYEDWVDIQYEFYNDFTGLQWYMEYKSSNKRLSFPMADPWIWVWKHLVFTWDGVNQIKCYIDWVEVQPYNDYNPTFTYDVPSTYSFCVLSDVNSCRMSCDELIVENVTWSSLDVSSYFDANKAKYWIS